MPDQNEYTRNRIKDLFQKDDNSLEKIANKPLKEKKKEKRCKTDKRGFVKCPDGRLRWGWGYGWPGSGTKSDDSTDSNDSDTTNGETSTNGNGSSTGGDSGTGGDRCREENETPSKTIKRNVFRR